MKFLILLGVLATSAYARNMQPGFLCEAVEGIEAFISPGLETEFENFCVPQIQQQIDQCKPSQIQSDAGMIANDLCGEFDRMLINVCDKIPIAALKNALLNALKPGGFFERNCDTDLKKFLVQQLTDQCQGIGNLNAKQICDEAYSELFDSLTYCGVNTALKCPVPANINCQQQ